MFLLSLIIFSTFRDFALTGDYRYIVIRPADLKFEIMNYSNKNTILTKSDWDLIKPQDEETKVNSEDTNIGNCLISDFQYLKIFNL